MEKAANEEGKCQMRNRSATTMRRFGVSREGDEYPEEGA
jgi:hypothetical protein